MPHMKPITLSLTLVLLSAAALSGCGKARKAFPDADPGWHSRDYSIVFGRLQRIAARNPDEPPVWLIRYDLAKDRYRGEFALSPPEKLVGYSGGEMVEIRGAIKSDSTPGTYPGSWYEIHAIRLWTSYSGK